MLPFTLKDYLQKREQTKTGTIPPHDITSEEKGFSERKPPSEPDQLGAGDRNGALTSALACPEFSGDIIELQNPSSSVLRG